MKSKILLCLSFALSSFAAIQGQTLEECREAAQRNYPLIRQYDLLSTTSAIAASNVQKEWLPQLSALAQATLQSDVTAWPAQMQHLMQQMGIGVEGLRKDQYRVGLDVAQLLFDGGAISSRKEMTRRQGDVQKAQTDVTLFQVRQRVGDMFFALLLADEQLRLTSNLLELLTANERQLAAMLKGGTASESDHAAVKAERLTTEQQLHDMQARRRTLAWMLSVFCGIEVTQPVKPAPLVSDREPGLQRPELTVIDAQLRLTDAESRSLDAALMPRLGIFAQGYYGYPGLNMFEDMMHHRWTLNGIVGARLTWNIGALYTRKNDKARLQAQRAMYEVQRDVFLFNNRLDWQQQNDDIARYRQLMQSDAEIISLRSSVRQAAESKLTNGIIDVSGLLREINAENAARVQQSVHEIEMLKEMYKEF